MLQKPLVYRPCYRTARNRRIVPKRDRPRTLILERELRAQGTTIPPVNSSHYTTTVVFVQHNLVPGIW